MKINFIRIASALAVVLLLMSSCKDTSASLSKDSLSRLSDINSTEDTVESLNELKSLTPFEAGKKQLEFINSDKVVFAYVNRTPIHTNEIDNKVFINQWMVATNISACENDTHMSESEREKAISDIKKSLKSREQIIHERIRTIILGNEAVKLGLEATYEEAKKQVEENHKFMDSSGDDDSYYGMIKGMGIEYDEYVAEHEIPVVQSVMTISNLRQHFIATLDEFKKGDEEYADSEYEKYIQKLIQKANIKYVK